MSSVSIEAHGNTWAHTPPVCGQDILRTAATVAYDVSLSCP